MTRWVELVLRVPPMAVAAVIVAAAFAYAALT